MLAPDAQLGILFVFVGSLATLRYIDGDLIGTVAGAAAALIIAALFVRTVIRGQSQRKLALEGLLAAAVGVLGIFVGWFVSRWL